MPEVSRIRAQLGKELKATRTLAGMSQRALHASLGATPSQVTLSRIENGTAVPDRDLVTRWLAACDASDEVRSRVQAQLDAVHNETRTWPEVLGDEPHLQNVARLRDENASLIRNCQMTWIPGLLQTAEYARLLVPLIDPAGRFDHAEMVADRMNRQQILYGTGRTFEFLISEGALLWAPGEDVMPAQLDRLVSIATLSSVRLGILPAHRVGTAAWHSFIYREAAEGDRPSVTTELVHGGGSVTEHDSVALYTELWSRLWEAAAVGPDARAVIERIAAGYRSASRPA